LTSDQIHSSPDLCNGRNVAQILLLADYRAEPFYPKVTSEMNQHAFLERLSISYWALAVRQLSGDQVGPGVSERHDLVEKQTISRHRYQSERVIPYRASSRAFLAMPSRSQARCDLKAALLSHLCLWVLAVHRLSGNPVGSEASERHDLVMGWTPPDGIDVPEWRC